MPPSRAADEESAVERATLWATTVVLLRGLDFEFRALPFSEKRYHSARDGEFRAQWWTVIMGNWGKWDERWFAPLKKMIRPCVATAISCLASMISLI